MMPHRTGMDTGGLPGADVDPSDAEVHLLAVTQDVIAGMDRAAMLAQLIGPEWVENVNKIREPFCAELLDLTERLLKRLNEQREKDG